MRGAGRVVGGPLTFDRGLEGAAVLGAAVVVEVEEGRRCGEGSWRRELVKAGRNCCFRRPW